ncbi:hypothetical protein L1049_010532 [Liquidambar formosana]|uniref:F-box protein n=1 Tax=Liquidambar formosana TaxID=63359 RepID=A0AAP0R4Y5_LIQFO
MQQWPSKVDDREAMVIAETMPRLLHLELGFGRFGDRGLNAILTKCKALTHLDIQGCWRVELEGDFEDKFEKLLTFKGPWVNDYESDNDSSEEDGDEGSFFLRVGLMNHFLLGFKVILG